MSETKDPRRTRRRASRTAGPPVEDATEQLDAGTAAATQTAATEKLTIAETESTPAARTDTGDASPAEPAGGVAGEETEAISEYTAAATTVRLGKSDAEPSGAGDKESDAPTVIVTLAKEETPEPGSTDLGSEHAQKAGTRRTWKRVVALTAAAVLVIGLVGAAVVSMIAVQSTAQRDERRADYVATARQTVLNLTTIRADTAKEDIDRILTMASGEFKTEFDGRIDPFTEIVKQAKVVSTGEVVEAAVERDDEKSGVVLVAAKQTLTNAGAEGEQQRFYRFRVTVQRADDGTLTASDVEFVA
jgi:Mce-associated membrane protein